MDHLGPRRRAQVPANQSLITYPSRPTLEQSIHWFITNFAHLEDPCLRPQWVCKTY